MARKNSTRKDAVLLTKANAVKSGLQLLTPLVLVRLIDQAAFGEYRLFWLVANTATMFLRLEVDRSLLYFLPRASEADRARLVAQTMLYFLGVSVVAGLVLLILPRFLSGVSDTAPDPGYILVAFTMLWIFGSPVRVLPSADQNIPWQAAAITWIAVLRMLTVIATAWLTRDVQYVFVGLLGWSIIQFGILAYYVGTRFGFAFSLPSRRQMSEQLEYALPFGVAQLLLGARRKGEQWIVSFLFMPVGLAVFSIGMSFNVTLTMIRRSVANVLIPKMSGAHGAGNTDRALELNNRGNVVVFAAVAPVIALLFVYAEPIVHILYTEQYVGAVPILRVYLLALAVMSIEFSSVMMVLAQGGFIARINMVSLVVSLTLSYLGALAFGMTGVAIGALAGECLTRVLSYLRGSSLLERPISTLQDWNTLGRILGAAVVASITSYYVGAVALEHSNRYVSVVVGGIAIATIYVAALNLFGLGWLVKYVLKRGEWNNPRT